MASSPVPIPHPSGPLAGYRVLDFSDEKGQLCARFLGELGADVIKVEPPRTGDPTRGRGPFFRGEEGLETSLWWWTMNAGKRSITCQLQLSAGRELVQKLVAQADIVIETCMPPTAADIGLDYATLSAANPGIVVVSITNFGQTGPYRSWQATDMVGAAMGGLMSVTGDPERGPVRILAPQALTQANIQAGVGAMTALYARGVNGGVGQHVDVSMQEAVVNALDHSSPTYDILGIDIFGPGIRRVNNGQLGARYLYEAKDGWVAALQAGHLIGPGANAIIDWLAETGEANGLDAPEWREKLTALVPLSVEDRTRVEETMIAFCRTRMKEDLVREAQARNAGWAPVFSPAEIVESKQLAARDYFVRVNHEDIGESFTYAGAPWKLSETPWAQRGRAPHLGEHNEDVYGELLGLEPADLRRLRMKMVI